LFGNPFKLTRAAIDEADDDEVTNEFNIANAKVSFQSMLLLSAAMSIWIQFEMPKCVHHSRNNRSAVTGAPLRLQCALLCRHSPRTHKPIIPRYCANNEPLSYPSSCSICIWLFLFL
jgi:hypothetical protein